MSILEEEVEEDAEEDVLTVGLAVVAAAVAPVLPFVVAVVVAVAVVIVVAPSTLSFTAVDFLAETTGGNSLKISIKPKGKMPLISGRFTALPLNQPPDSLKISTC
jgi:hypothetical protein